MKLDGGIGNGTFIRAEALPKLRMAHRNNKNPI